MMMSLVLLFGVKPEDDPIILHGFFLSLETKLLCQKKLLINPIIHIFYGVLI